jgi:hypothetical protein
MHVIKTAVGVGDWVQVTRKGATDPRQTTGKGAQLNGLGLLLAASEGQGSVASHGGRERMARVESSWLGGTRLAWAPSQPLRPGGSGRRTLRSKHCPGIMCH